MVACVGSLDPPARLLMGSGPSNPEPRVLRAMATPPLAADDPCVAELLAHIDELLRRTFRTSSAHTLPVPGASRAGIEAVLSSLIEPGDRVLIGVYGHFGELLCTLAGRHGATVERVDAEWGWCVEPEMLVDAIRRLQPKVVAIVHADTSTGILQPLETIGQACQESGALFVVDAVLSLGGCEVSVDAWRLDAAIGGMQKCLGGPPGLAPLVYSARVANARATRTSPPHSLYLDVQRLSNGPNELPVPMLYALREALRMIDEETLEVRWARHAQASAALRAGLVAMGLGLFGDPLHRVPMISLVRIPRGLDDAEVRHQLLAEHGVEIMAAFGPLRGRVWRIGTMGANARSASVLHALGALEAALSARGHSLPRGAAVDAARQAFA
jgi:(S)-ureidoglycine---glyoxylate transaminase